MKRKYIVAVLLLLSMGVLSTLAISYNTGTLEESWGIQYTLDYADAELSLSNPETELINSTCVKVTLDAAHTEQYVKAQLMISALDGSDQIIMTDSSTGTGCWVRFLYQGTLVESINIPKGDTVEFTTTHTMTEDNAMVDRVEIWWHHQDGLQAEYESARITVTDV